MAITFLQHKLLQAIHHHGKLPLDYKPDTLDSLLHRRLVGRDGNGLTALTDRGRHALFYEKVVTPKARPYDPAKHAAKRRQFELERDRARMKRIKFILQDSQK